MRLLWSYRPNRSHRKWDWDTTRRTPPSHWSHGCRRRGLSSTPDGLDVCLECETLNRPQLDIGNFPLDATRRLVRPTHPVAGLDYGRVRLRAPRLSTACGSQLTPAPMTVTSRPASDWIAVSLGVKSRIHKHLNLESITTSNIPQDVAFSTFNSHRSLCVLRKILNYGKRYMFLSQYGKRYKFLSLTCAKNLYR
ncbi:hypothetical protein HMPREF1207_05462 [Paenibacillus sp. HGH0039]|nr:hypothetical protein HMPREF1207_05462 [Paenibacillus sp. HGH0039]